jgi:DNA-binding CsgD family transcriptional regulator
MINFEQFVESSLAIQTEEELFDLYQSTVADFGFDRVVYTLVTDHPSFKKPAKHAVFGNYPSDWMAYYREQNFEKIDPVIKTAALSKVPFSWADIMTPDNWTLEQKKFMSAGEEAGLRDGACIPVFGGPGEVAGVGLASSMGGIKVSKTLLHMLRAITTQFHFRYCEIELEKINSDPHHHEIHLTPREKEILNWYAEGKSDPIIAEILGISQDAVKFHTKNLYGKLGVSDRIRAVLTALRMGLINPYQLR